MRAIRVEAFGGPEVLRVSEVPDPVPGPGEVVVTVRAVGVNPADGMAAIHAEPRNFLAAGLLRPVIREEVPFAEAPRAHERVMESGALGKLVLMP